jgi:hypothetical protein
MTGRKYDRQKIGPAENRTGRKYDRQKIEQAEKYNRQKI